MATFAIYNYKFRDVDNIGIFMGQEDDTLPLRTIQEKQAFVQKIFHDDIHGGRQFECSRVEETKSADGKGKRKVKATIKYGSKVVWEKEGLILLMISNPFKSITKHENFQKRKEKDEPWCHVLIDNRDNREFIAIEKNASFTSPDTVANILESSLRARLAPHHVTIEIKNSYEPDAFWEAVDKYQSWGIYELIFRFAAPNPAWQAKLIGSISDAAKDMNARPSTVFSSTDGDPLILSKSNQELCNYIDACALGGEDIVIKVKGIRSRIHIKDVKDKYIFKQMSEDTFRQILSGEPDLFDENFDAFTAFLNQIKTTQNNEEKE